MDVFASDTHRLHDTLELTAGTLINSTEAPVRAETIATALRHAGHTFVAPNALDDEAVTRVHTPEYLAFLATAWERWAERFGEDTCAMAFCWPDRGGDPLRPTDLVGQLGYHSFAADCSIGPGTWAAVSEGAAIAQSAADAVVEGCTLDGPTPNGSAVAYGLCRPPGHHATADQFGGYCYLNNSAIAAQRLRDAGMSRVAILDVDYHHGNGTQSIFYGRDDVLTISLHADPVFEFPWFAGHATETGAGDGHGWNLNLPLPAATAAEAWNEALSIALARVASAEPNAVVVALGVDTYIDDPLGTFTLETNDYTAIARRLQQLDLPTVILQEGGYATEEIGTNVAAFLNGFV